MTSLTRRTLIKRLLANSLVAKPVAESVAATGAMSLAAGRLSAQPGQKPAKFGYDNVVQRARDLAAVPFDAAQPQLPDALAKLSFDAWRDISFRRERAFLNFPGSQFRLFLYHPGYLYRRPVVINTIRDGIPTPIPYTASLFDFGGTKIAGRLPVNIGFAGFHLNFPLNAPNIFDEAIGFLGASYFRVLGRKQRYGQSARALAVNIGTNVEEFPFFREFWIAKPEPNVAHATIYGLLDGTAATGAYQFDVYPDIESRVEITATLFPRKTDVKFALAPLTSMFFIGANDHSYTDDFRPQLHDSDGLLLNSGTGEWVWRPLRNPKKMELSGFVEHNPRGYGLMQRDRNFADYQDLDLAYEARPSYFVEPRGPWGEGQVELVEMNTIDETNDNIVAAFVRSDPIEAGASFSYGLTSSLDSAAFSPNGRVVNTFQTIAQSLGAPDHAPKGSRRFLIDFAGDDLAYYAPNPQMVEVVATATRGKILRASTEFNSHTNGFRATIDVELESGQSTDLRAFLRANGQTLTETWTYPWRAD